MNCGKGLISPHVDGHWNQNPYIAHKIDQIEAYQDGKT
jgi:hypothetical protein